VARVGHVGLAFFWKVSHVLQARCVPGRRDHLVGSLLGSVGVYRGLLMGLIGDQLLKLIPRLPPSVG